MGVKERRGLLGGVVSSREQERHGQLCCCVGSAVSVFLLDPRVLISMQKFEVGEMYIFGRPTSFFPYEL